MRNVGYLVAIVGTVALASYLAFDVSRAGTPSFVLLFGGPMIALAFIAVLRARHDGVLRSWLSVRSGDFTRGFLAAAVLFAAAYAFMRIVAPPDSPRASWLARIYLQLGDPVVLRQHVPLVVAGLIAISLAEELVWRGLVLGLLAEAIGSRRAWVWAAVLYAVAHLPTVWALRDPVAGANPVIVVAALGCGLVWGGMARRFDRLMPGLFSHVLFDWVVVMMFRLWGPSI